VLANWQLRAGVSDRGVTGGAPRARVPAEGLLGVPVRRTVPANAKAVALHVGGRWEIFKIF
jgi:hypothetical protein